MTAIKLNLKEVERAFSDLERKQVPFAAAKALTQTAKQVQKELERQLPIKLDRPTPFTRRAFGTVRATKSRLRSTIFVKDLQAEYLSFAIHGGHRDPDNKRILMPKNIKLNKYGNIANLKDGKKVKALLAKPNTFKGTVKGVPGIWQRVNRNKKVKLLIRFETGAEYKPRFPFFQIAGGVARAKVSRNFVDALEFAVKTAR